MLLAMPRPSKNLACWSAAFTSPTNANGPKLALTLAATPGIFHSAVGHRVKTPAWGVADDERADFEFAISSEDAAGIACEEAGLQTVS